MMRKLFPFVLSVTLSLALNTSAQTYHQINALSGTNVISGTTVTVTQSAPAPNSATMCATGPYQVGKDYADWYNYDFSSNPVTHFRVQMIRVHDDDSIQILVNGAPYSSSVVSPYNSTVTPAPTPLCTYTTNNMNFPGNGLVTTTGGATGKGQGVQIDITNSPGLINSVRVIHTRAASNNLASDVIYSAFFADDTCFLDFEATVNAPVFCTGQDVQFSATNYPNTIYTWTSSATPAPVFSPSANDREPTIKSVTQLNAGIYFVEGKRGDCTYTDDVQIAVTPAPSIGIVKQAGPMCPGGDDTLSVPNVNLPTGGDVYAWSASGLTKFDVTQGYIIEFPNVQPISKGWYSVYAVDVIGCHSDTVDFFFDVLAGVAAGFNYDVKEGCEEDTVIFKNTSISNITQVWDFGDNSAGSADSDPTHYYTVPKPNNAARTHTVKLMIGNGSCADTATQDIVLNHPLITDFTIDDDSICQGTPVTFTNNSVVKSGTIPTFMWNNGYGDDFRVFTLTHTNQYNEAGIYYPELTVTDYLGCVGSQTLELVVDSTGGIVFDTDKDEICVGDEIVFNGDYYAGGANSVLWDFSDGTTNDNALLLKHSYTEPGTYVVTYSVDYRICPDLQYSREIKAKEYPNLYLGEDTAICPNGNPIFIGDLINDAGSDDVTYQWHTATKDITKGIYVHHPGVYAVTADKDGCAVSDSIEVKKNCYINIPNAFTPDGDGNSDYFLPRQLLSRNVTVFGMQVYNRWGQLVFESNAANGRGWDGKFKGEDQPTGVYVYTIQVTFGNGVSERYQGNVTLLR